jgi:hypothetical protein
MRILTAVIAILVMKEEGKRDEVRWLGNQAVVVAICQFPLHWVA